MTQNPYEVLWNSLYVLTMDAYPDVHHIMKYLQKKYIEQERAYRRLNDLGRVVIPKNIKKVRH
ncbi:hypothetical protein E308F_29810 [Moorella sp. E308F]|uniref:hypothetical protein n=1 Tax=Moorella sp. E308F TaxID=2572682 RepID=UPI0010FFB3EB|nr:hypothetical protein [Moorella sp. E308F]GEA16735.1 hypothetical protein E308F_29810 [Moorella sp. E308F]